MTLARCLALALVLAAVATAQDRPRVGLVLSGGGARGAAHVGVLQVLEDLRVPVDYVVGTSMGSIIAALYAAGYSPDEMATIVEQADWSSILSDAPPRDELWFRRRQDDRRFLVDLELGWRDGAPVLPPGLILGRNVEAFLERLLLPVARVDDFDGLRIPFRCVATDIRDGAPFVFERGSLVKAIRASMSIPGVFSPVVVDDHVLVDGGVVDNVPVDIARSLGAEVVIVVDISTPLADPATLTSLVGVSNQVIGILMDTNRRNSMESLTDADVAIVPDLGDLGSMDFERSTEAIEVGRAAADAIRPALARLAVDPAAWDAWRARQRMPAFEPPTIRGLTLDNRSGLSDRVIRAFSELHAGAVLDAEVLEQTREQLAGLGLFERIEIDVDPVPESPNEADVVLRTVEKGWGPHYLRFGIGASSDMRGGGDFDIGVQHTWTPINGWGGEWRNEVQIGTFTRLYSEFYQPLDPDLRWFVAPWIEYGQRDVPLTINRQKIALIHVEGLEAGVALGRNLGSWGEIRAGYSWADGSASPEIALPGLFPARIDLETGQFRTRLLVDTLDNVRFPRDGLIGVVDWEYADESVGADARKSILVGSIGKPMSFGPLTIFPQIEGGTTFAGETLLGEFELGGFQRLSGLDQRELSGNHYALGVVQAYYQLTERTTQFGTATYVGASLELGGIWASEDAVDARDLIFGGSAFVAADTFVGPGYVALGVAEGGDHAIYVFIGPTF